MTKFYIFYGSKYQAESGGVFGALVDATAIRRASFEEVGERLASGEAVFIRPATTGEIGAVEINFAKWQASRPPRENQSTDVTK